MSLRTHPFGNFCGEADIGSRRAGTITRVRENAAAFAKSDLLRDLMMQREAHKLEPTYTSPESVGAPPPPHTGHYYFAGDLA